MAAPNRHQNNLVCNLANAEMQSPVSPGLPQVPSGNAANVSAGVFKIWASGIIGPKLLTGVKRIARCIHVLLKRAHPHVDRARHGRLDGMSGKPIIFDHEMNLPIIAFLNGLLAGTAKALVFRRIIGIGSPAFQHAARLGIILKYRVVLRVVELLRLFLGVNMIEVAVKFIEAMYGRQIFIPISEFIMAEPRRHIAS